MTTIASRFRQIREDKKMTITAVAAAIGEKRQRLQDIEAGNQKVPEDVIVKYIEYFDIDANWLFTGIGRMYKTGGSLSERQKALLDNYENMDEKCKRTIEAAASAAAQPEPARKQA